MYFAADRAIVHGEREGSVQNRRNIATSVHANLLADAYPADAHIRRIPCQAGHSCREADTLRRVSHS